MDLRFATAEDIPSLLALAQRVVPQMRADGNLQWDANLGYRFAGEISLKIRPGCGSFVTRSDLPSVRTLQKDLVPQTFVFLFEFSKTLAKRRNHLDDLLLCVSRRDVLLAVPIECLNTDDNNSLDDSAHGRRAKFVDKLLRAAPLSDFGMPQNLQAALSRIVHQE